MDRYNIPGVTTFEYTKIVGVENIEFGQDVLIDDFVFIYAKSKTRIGSSVHIASFVSITGGESLTMGDFSGIASGSRIITASDDFKGWGFGNPTVGEEYRNVKRAPIHIGKFCIVGANSVVLPGVTVGDGAVIGAGSTVTRDLAPWGIYLGNRKVGERDRDGVLRNYERYLRDTQAPGKGR